MNKKETLLSKWCDQAWLYCVYGLGIIMLNVLIWNWYSWDTPQKLMCGLAILVTVHIFEENTLPGGFAYMNNIGQKSAAPLVYPQNRLTNMWTNLGATILFIVLTFFAPQIPAICVTVVTIFGVAECIHHTKDGINMYKRYKDKGKKTIYGPGLINSYVGLLQLSVIGLKWILENKYQFSDFAFGLLIIVCVMVFGILIPFAISRKIKSQRFAFKDKGYFTKFE
ncbi:Uncharacterised protein [Clostridioides difficile]|nr:Uncharacterised protein [Clostridioides difficile]